MPYDDEEKEFGDALLPEEDGELEADEPSDVDPEDLEEDSF